MGSVDWSEAEQKEVKTLLEEGCREEPVGNSFIGGLFHMNDGQVNQQIN